MYYEYDDLILGRDYCWDREGIMIPDTYNSFLATNVHAVNSYIKTCATIMLKDINSQANLLEVSPSIEDYEVDDAIIIHLFWLPQMGQWLLDGLANLWPLFDKNRPSDNIMIIYSSIPSFFPEVYKKYLISRNQFIIPKRIKKAYIPRKTFGIDSTIEFRSEQGEIRHPLLPRQPFKSLREVKSFMSDDKKHVETVQWFGDLHRTPPTKIHKKVLLNSRQSHIIFPPPNPCKLLIDNLEKSSEWTIIDFEADNISIGDQINMLENADVIAGTMGSDFYRLLMTRHFKGKVIYLEKKFCGDARYGYEHQNRMMNLDAEFKNIESLDSELEEITKYLMEV